MYIRLITGIIILFLSVITYLINSSSKSCMKIGSSEKKYTYHKYENIERKYSNEIEILLQNDPDFIEDKSGNIVDWSDKNSKSKLQDYYPFPKVSIIDKKYLPILFPKIIPNTFIKGNFDDFVKKSNKNVFFLKPADKYIGGAKGILISNNPYELYDKFIENNFVIQEEIDPMLIDGYKFDIRTYVLIVYNKSYIHVYYNYGIIRYCKEKYEDGSIDPDKQITIYGKFDYVNNNEKIKPYLNSILEIIYLTLTNLKIPNRTGYQYLGYDMIISKSKKLYLLEVNIQPSLKRVNFDIDILQYFTKLVVKPALTTNRGYRPLISYMNNIILAEPNNSHLNDLYNITKDYEVMKYIGNLKSWSYEKTKRFIEYGPSEEYYYKVIVSNSNILYGIIGIYKNKTPYYNLVIFLGKNNFNKGIGTSALKLFLLTIENNIKIYADVLNTNIRSISFFSKMGYRFNVIDKIHRFDI